MSKLKVHKGNVLDIFSADTETELHLPFIDAGISAGFPSPALVFTDLGIDLNKHLV
jgi:DNA polymerase V